jgi:hypothetical protein
MTIRVRTKAIPFPSGGTNQWTLFGTPQPLETQTNVDPKLVYRARCDDVVDSPGDHPLTIEKRIFRATPLSGKAGVSNNFVVCDKWYAEEQMSNNSHIALPALPAFDAAAFLARVNPNKGQIGVPEFLREFRELPKLVQLAGNSILKKGAGAYLTYQFGWKPLISDVKKMMDFTGRVNRKINELHALYQNGGIHRRRSIANDTVQTQSTGTLTGLPVTVLKYKLASITQRTRWATTRFVPTTLPPRDESDYRRRAIQIVLGMDLSPSTAWQLMPWSWLIDWFGNVGDYLVQFNNTCPVRATPPCLMTYTKTIETLTRTDTQSGMLGGAAVKQRETKSRAIVVPTLTASIPFLTGRQLSILGALAITRHRAR